MTRGSRRFWLILLIAALAAAVALRHFEVRGRREPAARGRTAVARNLLLVTIDTLRADRIGRGLTPNIDGLAATGLSFTNARTAAPLTLPRQLG
jgi:ribosomal protein L13E